MGGRHRARKRSRHKVNLGKSDPTLKQRVEDVCDSGAVQGQLTTENVRSALIDKHPEYKVWKKLNETIHTILVRRTEEREGGDSDSADSEADMDVPDKNNMMNNSLLYKKPRLDEQQQEQDDKPAEQSLQANQSPSKPSSIFDLARSSGTALPKRSNSESNSLNGTSGGVVANSSTTNNKKKRKRRHLGGDQDAPGIRQLASAGEGFADVQAERPKVRFADMGGIESCLQDVRELCSYPISHPEIYRHLGVDPPLGILLHGPPGCGKTMLARAIAGELGVTFFNVSAPEIVSGMSGESEEKIRQLFKAAKACAPAIVFIDEIDAITGKRDTSSRGMERRIVAQLLTSMDSLRKEESSAGEVVVDDVDEDGDRDVGPNNSTGNAEGGGDNVLVIGATNRPDSLDPALRRAGRFDREIALGIPDASAREHILACITKKMRLSGDFSFGEIARVTPGYVGADLVALAKEAAVIAVNRVFSDIAGTPSANTLERRALAGQMLRDHSEPLTKAQMQDIYVTMRDFLSATKKVQPSAKREGFATVPSVTWDDIGSLAKVREELSMAITEPIKNPERFSRMGLSAPAGVLLFGPPGCGKTLLAKAIANGSGSNFISVKGPELLNKYVGESERAVRQVFTRARSSAPCVVFFDELDSLCPRRGSDGSNGVSERVVNQLLTEMDGLEERKNVFVVAATNRPDIIDPAMLRPGRLDKLLFVPLPDRYDRADILQKCARMSPLDPDVDLKKIALSDELDGFTGADLAALVKEAALNALRAVSTSDDSGQQQEVITQEDFNAAMKTMKPSVSLDDQRMYTEMRLKLTGGNAKNLTKE